jgi:hypothetical protein
MSEEIKPRKQRPLTEIQGRFVEAFASSGNLREALKQFERKQRYDLRLAMKNPNSTLRKVMNTYLKNQTEDIRTTKGYSIQTLLDTAEELREQGEFKLALDYMKELHNITGVHSAKKSITVQQRVITKDTSGKIIDVSENEFEKQQ